VVPAGAFSDFLRPGRRYSLATAGRGAACPTDGVAAADRPPAGAADPCGGLIASSVAGGLGRGGASGPLLMRTVAIGPCSSAPTPPVRAMCVWAMPASNRH
jgi:hypothetical protein